MALVHAVGALLTHSAAVTERHPFDAAVVIVGCLLPRIFPLTVGRDLYWTAWWILLVCWAVGGAEGTVLWDKVRRTPSPQEPGWWSRLCVRTGECARRIAGRVGARTLGAGAPIPANILTAPRLSEAIQSEVCAVSPEVRVEWVGQPQTGADRHVSDLRRLLTVEATLKARIVGQDHVAAAITKALLRRAVDSDSRRPVLSVLAAGPTGVGKSETAKALAEILDRPLLAYDMASFGEQHTVAALIGAPPGYAGAERCGRLVADVQRHPNAVVLLDEIDKAHPTLLDPFMRVFEDGQFTELSRGESANFGDTVVIATTNLLQREATISWSDDPAQVRRMLLQARAGYPEGPSRSFSLRPELIARLDITILYRPLSAAVVERIAHEYVPAFVHRITTQMGIHPEVTVDARLVDEIIGRLDLQFGVRELKRVVGERLGDALVEGYLPWMMRGEIPVAVEVRATSGQITAVFR